MLEQKYAKQHEELLAERRRSKSQNVEFRQLREENEIVRSRTQRSEEHNEVLQLSNKAPYRSPGLLCQHLNPQGTGLDRS